MWQLGSLTLASRLLLGTAQYPSPEELRHAIRIAKTEIITVSLRRETAKGNNSQSFWDQISDLGCHILPNTAGCRTANEAITTAQMARDLFSTNFIKLEVIGDDYNLQPEPIGLIKASEALVKQGFEVLAYCTDDLVLCRRLVNAGVTAIMPWAAPIGSGKGIINPYALQVLRQRLPNTTIIIDAGLGAPSHATLAMEMGFDGVLLNSAVAYANQPANMAAAFRDAVIAGRTAYEAGLMPSREMAKPSTPTIDQPFWHGEYS